MAGDWIKLRVDLQTHPKVVRILSATKSDKFRVIGGLHAVWSVFDTHSEDGKLIGYTPETLDHIIGWDGFSMALISVGWMVENDGFSLEMPEFAEHNGQSGKRRAEDQKRKRETRKNPRSVRNLSASEPDEKLTREEKRREDTTTNVVVSDSRSKPRKKLPTDFVPNEKGISLAVQKMIDVNIEIRKFCDYHTAKGSVMADWQAAWRTWVGNAKPSASRPKTFKEIDRENDIRSWEEMTGRTHPSRIQSGEVIDAQENNYLLEDFQ